MAAQKHLLLVLLVAATGAEAARFPSRFSMRTNHRQVVPGNGDQSSGSGVSNSMGSSVTSASSHASSAVSVLSSSSATNSYYAKQSTVQQSTDTSVTEHHITSPATDAYTTSQSSASPTTKATMIATDSTQTLSTRRMTSEGTTPGDYSDYGSGTGGSSMGDGNTGGTGGLDNGNGGVGGGNGNGNGIGDSGGDITGSGTNSSSGGQSQRPNILIFICDDLGRTDLSYTEGNIWTPTPHIDKLAWDGIILNRFYANPICTPTRAAFMTGKYPFRTGMQTASIAQGEPWGVPLEFKFQPQYFKNLGYQTYHVGKWHLGEFTRQYYPEARGFDYSYGFTGGAANWWNYTEGWITPVPLSGRDVRENGKRILANDTNNAYYPDLINHKAEQIIRNQDPSKPFYLYYATPLVRSASNGFGDAQASVPRFQLRPSALSFSEQFPERKRQLALIQALDDTFMRITEAVVNKGIANNTILVFLADNGAPVPKAGAFVRGSNYGVNWPLRQGKGTLFEGGTRVNAFIWSPLLKKRGRVTNQLFHSTDWLPTLYEAAGGNLHDLAAEKLDGFSHWKSLQSGLNYGPRKELVSNIDQLSNQYAMIYEDQYGGLYKLLGGNVLNNAFTGWFPPPGTNAGNTDETPNWKTWTPISINCNFPEGQEVSPCVPWKADCLFDLTNDPCETNNIAESYPAMLKLLQSKIKAYNSTSYPAVITGYDPASNPDLWEGWWVPWKDPQPFDEGVTTNPLIPVESF